MTELLYITQPELYTFTAKFGGIIQTEKGPAVILDRTIFYPQGGGQPGDTGLIFNKNERFSITKTISNEEILVLHLFEQSEGSIVVGEK